MDFKLLASLLLAFTIAEASVIRPVYFAAQEDHSEHDDHDHGDDVLFNGDVEDEADTIAVVPQQQQRGRSGRVLGLVTAGAQLASSAAAAVGPSLAGAAAITSSIKPLVWGGLGGYALLNHFTNKSRKGGYYVSGPKYIGSSYVNSEVVSPYQYNGGRTGYIRRPRYVGSSYGNSEVVSPQYISRPVAESYNQW